jgi:uncharacterized DUF497 family protein
MAHPHVLTLVRTSYNVKEKAGPACVSSTKSGRIGRIWRSTVLILRRASLSLRIRALTQLDEVHDEEERFITLGEIARGVVLFVVHTSFAAPDGEEVVRLISARAATSREKRIYEETYKRAEAPNRRNRRKNGRQH